MAWVKENASAWELRTSVRRDERTKRRVYYHEAKRKLSQNMILKRFNKGNGDVYTIDVINECIRNVLAEF